MRKVFLQQNVMTRIRTISIKPLWVLLFIVVASCNQQVKNKKEKEMPKTREILKGYLDTIQGEAVWICEDPAYEADAFDDSTSEYASVMKMDADRNPLGMGIINRKGEIMVPIIYDGLFTGSSNGYFLVIKDDKDGNDKYGMVNLEGREIVSPQYDYIEPNPIDGFIHVTKGEKTGLINTKGEIVIPVMYASLITANEGMIAFMNVPQRWGYINLKNEVIIKPEFTNPEKFVNGKAILQKPGGEEYIVYKDGRIEKK